MPVRLQMSNVECRAACLAMVLSYYGRNTRTAECREQCDAGRDGLGGHAMGLAARAHGLLMRALSVPTELVGEVRLPAVAHWEGNHFLVVERVTATQVDGVASASGRRTFTREKFAEGFTGVMLEFTPTPALQQRKRTPTRSGDPWRSTRAGRRS